MRTKNLIRWRSACALAWAALALLGLAGTPAQGQVGDTRIANWQGDQTAVFLLMFDDSWPSHYQVALPELVERDMIATFYINPGKGEYKALQPRWENEVWKAGMAYGNHTMTHRGTKNFEHAKHEIGQCNKIITDIVPGKTPRLISWAKPGVPREKWNITKAQLQSLLKEYHLINRPPFRDHGAVYHMQKAPPMLALADKAIASGGMEYLVIHGLERRAPMNTKYQDFWPLNQDVYRELLDGLQARRDRGDLWITDHISYHQYLTQRDTAKVKTVQVSDQEITLNLTCDADPQFYDLPMTLITQVPVTWKHCRITQADQEQTVAVADETVMFQAIPNGQPIVLQPTLPDETLEP